MFRISHRKWRVTRLQLIRCPDVALLGCCLVTLHFLLNILITNPVTIATTGLKVRNFPKFSLGGHDFTREFMETAAKQS